jgi:hypothetical protein
MAACRTAIEIVAIWRGIRPDQLEGNTLSSQLVPVNTDALPRFTNRRYPPDLACRLIDPLFDVMITLRHNSVITVTHLAKYFSGGRGSRRAAELPVDRKDSRSLVCETSPRLGRSLALPVIA